MNPLFERLLTILVDGLAVAIPLFLIWLRIYVNEKKARAAAEEERDEAVEANTMWEREHKAVLQQDPLDEDMANVQTNYTKALIKDKTSRYQKKGKNPNEREQRN